MKRFTLPLTTAISAAMLASAGCGSDKEWQTTSNTRICVDNTGQRIPEDQCHNRPSTGSSPFHWYYISRGGYVPSYYTPAGGGSFAPVEPFESYFPAPATAPEGAVTRGGFGSFGESHGGGGGGEGAGE